jgi:capsular polysaccharide biosynthesis protein
MSRDANAPVKTVAAFEEVRDCNIVDVQLPVEAVPAAATQTVQRAPLPALVADATAGWSPTRAVVVEGAALVTNGGLVKTAAGEVVRETVWDQEHWERTFRSHHKARPGSRVAGRCASIVSLWSENYFHWLFDSLPRLAVLQASGIAFDRLVVPAGLSRFHVETLEILGFGPERLQPFLGEHLIPDELVWCSPVAPIGRPPRFAVDWLRQNLHAPDIAPTKCMYLRRSNRTLANEQALLPLFIDAGFEIIDPSLLSVRDQVTLFADARFVAGPHGAAFANCVFSQDLTGLEIYQSTHANTSMTGLFAAAGHRHWSLVGRRVRALKRRQNQNFKVPVSEVESTLRAIAAAEPALSK